MENLDPISFEILKNSLISIAEEMGVVLRKSSFSPNIKERRDYSCALFNASGQLVAQAEHIQSNLGRLPSSVQLVWKGSKMICLKVTTSSSTIPIGAGLIFRT